MKKLKPSGWKRVAIITASIMFLLVTTACVYLQMPVFGRAPSGKRLARIQQSPHYRDGRFQNDTPTPTFAQGYTFWNELQKSLFTSWPEREPTGPVPAIKTDLQELSLNKDVVIWLAHASCFIQINGKRILVDPVFSSYASPVPGTVKAFEGTTIYTAEEMPAIDYLLISHDHYDHLDYKTVHALKEKVGKVVCGLGVGSHFERWGYDEAQIIEKDWRENVSVDSTLTIHVLPARHKSGRGLQQNNTLWASFLIKASTYSIYISGDGGYDTHFTEIGEEFGPIDLAIMECGQYDSAWRYVHLLPEEGMKAAVDLKAKAILPVHHAKFVLARHAWYEPLERITAAGIGPGMPRVITPTIGQPVELNEPLQLFSKWWKNGSKE